MKLNRKKAIIGIAAGLLALLGLTLGSSLALGHNLWDSCRKNDGLCYYPGDCRSYIDTNKDGICDRSQPEPAATTTKPETTQSSIIPIAPAADVSGGGTSSATIEATGVDQASGEQAHGNGNGNGNSRSYFLLPVLLGTAALYGITWVLSNRGVINVKIHRRIWNVVLLIATVISAFLGVYLILEIDFDVTISMPFNPLFWHVEAGIAMAMIAVFHIAWHWRYFTKMLSASRQAAPANAVPVPGSDTV